MMKALLPILLAIFAVVMFARDGAATVRTVDTAGFWGYSTIQSALDASTAGDEVHVTAGTYTENVTVATGKAVSLYGGYDPSTPGFRNTTTFTTVIDAGGSGSAISIYADATLDGFTVTGSSSASSSAGVYVYAASPTISNNLIDQNGWHGIYVESSSSPAINRNVISSNGKYGIYLYSFGNGGIPLVYNNTIDGNLRGIDIVSFDPVLRNNIVTNSTDYGIYAGVFSDVDNDYNDVWNNSSGDYYDMTAGPHDKSVDPLYVGSGDYRLSTSPTLSECIDAGVDVGFAYIGLPDMGRYEADTSRDTPWPPDGLVASPLSTKVYLDWLPNAEPNIAGYKVSYGTAPGVYTNTLDVGYVTDYTVGSLINGASYFFAVQAYNDVPNVSGYSAEVSATPSQGSPELPHYNWDASFKGGDCTACHRKENGSNLLPSGFDYRYDTGLCMSCHNLTGSARRLVLNQAKSHPVFINATTGGCNLPTYGNITGRFSNRMGDHLDPAGRLVCNTCHNVMEKTEDVGRVWELTSFAYEDSWQTYSLANGGWSYYDYQEPEVYASTNLMARPTYVRDRRPYLLSSPLKDYYPATGKIKFKVPFFDYAYVTLKFPYLRAANLQNMMCLDCHNIGTHELLNCLTCHDAHNYGNRLGIKTAVKTPNSGIKSVVFSNTTGKNSFADGDTVYNGICEVCHTKTTYYRNNGGLLTNHTSTGINYSGKNCLTCHTHVGGFYP